MSTGRTIRLSEEDDGWWVARDEEAGVTTQGSTRSAALENLDEAVALQRGEVGDSIDAWEEEAAVLDDLGIDPDEVKTARENNSISTPPWDEERGRDASESE